MSRSTTKAFGKNLELREQLQKLPYGSSKLILRSSYQKTLKLLESFGLNLEQPSTKVQSLVVTMPTMEDIDLDPTLSITSDLEDYAESIERSNLKWSITDPELIEQILAASSPNRTSMSCNRLYLQTVPQKFRYAAHCSSKTAFCFPS